MAKDAKGHGSEKRGGVSPSNQSAVERTMAALAAAHATRPVVGRHTDPSVGAPMTDAERAQKMAAWRDQGTSDAQVREGIRAMFNLPSKETVPLDPRRNDHANAIMKASGSPSPRTQPTPGQLVAAKIIRPQ